MIFIKDPIYAKVWKVEKPDDKKYISLRISTSRKNSESNEYKYSSWFAKAIGHAFNSLKDVKEGDRIVCTKTTLTNEPYTDKDGKTKSFFDFVISEATIGTLQTEAENGTKQSETASNQNNDDDNDPWS